MHVKLMLEGSEFDKARLADVFPDGKLPPALVFMQSNKYRCPHTKQLFPANDIEQAMLMAL